MGKLAVVQLLVESTPGEKFIMSSLLHDLTVTHHQDHIRFTDGGQPVGHDETGTALHHGVKGLLDPCLRPSVDGGSGFIQKQMELVLELAKKP